MKIGNRQQTVLERLVITGNWDAFLGGWLWNTPSDTANVLESLCKKGLAERTGAGKLNGYYGYVPTSKGIAFINQGKTRND